MASDPVQPNPSDEATLDELLRLLGRARRVLDAIAAGEVVLRESCEILAGHIAEMIGHSVTDAPPSAALLGLQARVSAPTPDLEAAEHAAASAWITYSEMEALAAALAAYRGALAVGGVPAEPQPEIERDICTHLYSTGDDGICRDCGAGAVPQDRKAGQQ